jgi:hypothetical protein
MKGRKNQMILGQYAAYFYDCLLCKKTACGRRRRKSVNFPGLPQALDFFIPDFSVFVNYLYAYPNRRAASSANP